MSTSVCLCYVDLVCHCDHLVMTERAVSFVFMLFCNMGDVRHGLLSFLLVSLVGGCGL